MIKLTNSKNGGGVFNTINPSNKIPHIKNITYY